MSIGTKAPLLFIGTYLNPGQGSRAASEDLALQLQKLGWSTDCTSRIHWAPGRIFDMLRTVCQRRHTYSIAFVDVFSGKAFLYAEAACFLLRRFNKPYILTLHGGQLPDFARRHPQRVKHLLDSAAAVTAPSAYLQRSMGCYREGIQLIPNAIEISRYFDPQREVIRPRVAWLRSFARIYNPMLAIDVMARLSRDFPEAILQMAGPDKDGSLAEVVAETRRRDLTKHVEIVGVLQRAEVPRFLSNADIFLNTTNADNTPVSVVEAMACGMRIVSTNVGGLPDLLTETEDSLMLAPGDSAGLAGAIARILNDPDLAKSMARNARRKAAQWDWATVLPQWTALISDCLMKNKGMATT